MHAGVCHVRDITTTEQGRHIEAAFDVGSHECRVYFRSDGAVLTANLEAFLACALLPCMRKAGSLNIDGPVSQRFLSALPRIVDVFRQWDPSLHQVEIAAVTPVVKKPPQEHRVGAFFTGGVDSFYTLLTHRDEITDLIFVHGFDIPLEKASVRRCVSERLRQAASQLGKRLVEVETNVRSFLDPYAEWRLLAHGPALAAVGHLLFPSFARIHIAASRCSGTTVPEGTHPLLDPLWSTESLEFIHDGFEAGRMAKIAFVSQSDTALQALRVCSRNYGGTYNCGRCEKCLRTMVSLCAAGALERCSTFAVPLSLRRVSGLVLGDSQRCYHLENLKALEAAGTHPALYGAVRQALDRPSWQVKLRTDLRLTLARYPLLYECARYLAGHR